jgi:endo-1,4-beta-mannosidase
MINPGIYYEPAWVAMDNALDIARKYRIRLFIPIINNHNGGDSNMILPFGDYAHIARFRSLPPSSFFISDVLKSDFKNLITYMLNRVNTVNGIRYGDDPTVIAWQLGNELGGWDGPPAPGDWSVEMAKHIKTLAPKTLVASGDMGGLDARYRYTPESLNSPYVDIISNHYYYGQSDLQRITIDSMFVADKMKVFVIGEFGLSNAFVYEKIYNIVLNSPNVSGAMIWSLRFHSRKGGYYVHNEKKLFYSYHVPGFNRNIYNN